jgi:hypothetical protein
MLRRARKFWSGVGAGIVATALLSGGIVAADGPWHFQFSPTQTKRRMVESVRFERVRSVDGVVSTSNGHSETQVVFEKKKNTYHIDFKMILSTISTDGRIVPNPVTDLLLNLPVSGATDSSGRLLEIRGFSALQKRAKQVLSPTMYKRVSPFLASDAMSQQFTDEWESRMGLVRDRTLKQGDLYEVTQNVAIPGNSGKMGMGVVWVEGASTADRTKDCVKIRVFEDTDLTRLVDEVRRWVPTYVPSVVLPAEVTEDDHNRVVAQTVYWIEPTTMLIRDEWSRKTVTMSRLADGTAVETRLMDERRTELKDQSSGN